AEGSVSIPVQFQDATTYQVIVEVDGILFQPIPPETATFTLNVGSSTPVTNQTVPEFGPIASLVLVFAIVGVVITGARTKVFQKF
ncbi:MAG TPA: hypothetical protein VEJ68_01990, partial [Candidatus Bathyarchaeia archaeon]|nr:hypothetical protein [Candidatus Bathyarchaeia archaeon]